MSNASWLRRMTLLLAGVAAVAAGAASAQAADDPCKKHDILSFDDNGKCGPVPRLLRQVARRELFAFGIASHGRMNR